MIFSHIPSIMINSHLTDQTAEFEVSQAILALDINWRRVNLGKFLKMVFRKGFWRLRSLKASVMAFAAV